MATGMRRKERVKFGTTVILKTDDDEIRSSKSRNVSLSGIFVETRHFLDVGTACHLEIILNSTNAFLSLEISGKVARKEDDGMGIVFDKMDELSFNHLKNIVYFNSPNADEYLKDMEEDKE